MVTRYDNQAGTELLAEINRKLLVLLLPVHAIPAILQNDIINLSGGIILAHFGRYATKAAYEHAKALRRINARRWRKTHKKQERIDWNRSNTNDFVKHNASLRDISNVESLLNARQSQLDAKNAKIKTERSISKTFISKQANQNDINRLQELVNKRKRALNIAMRWNQPVNRKNN